MHPLIFENKYFKGWTIELLSDITNIGNATKILNTVKTKVLLPQLSVTSAELVFPVETFDFLAPKDVWII